MSQAIKNLLLALVSGILFAWGLSLSQMVNPAKVINFLDIAGNWDPTLAFVMAGALVLTIPAFIWILKLPSPWFDSQFYLPNESDIDLRLVIGAIFFGIGWGVSGLCPGPAITALATGLPQIAGFVVAMLVGMYVHRLVFE